MESIIIDKKVLRLLVCCHIAPCLLCVFFSLAVCLFWVWNTFSPERTSVIHRDVNIFGWFDTFGLIWVHVDLGYSKHSIVCWITDYLFVCFVTVCYGHFMARSKRKNTYIHALIVNAHTSASFKRRKKKWSKIKSTSEYI